MDAYELLQADHRRLLADKKLLIITLRTVRDGLNELVPEASSMVAVIDRVLGLVSMPTPPGAIE
jgi:hypothetical protein